MWTGAFYPLSDRDNLHTTTCHFAFGQHKYNYVIGFFWKVVTGGQYDVDVTLFDPNKEAIYSQQKQQFDSFQFNAKVMMILF